MTTYTTLIHSPIEFDHPQGWVAQEMQDEGQSFNIMVKEPAENVHLPPARMITITLMSCTQTHDEMCKARLEQMKREIPPHVATFQTKKSQMAYFDNTLRVEYDLPLPPHGEKYHVLEEWLVHREYNLAIFVSTTAKQSLWSATQPIMQRLHQTFRVQNPDEVAAPVLNSVLLRHEFSPEYNTCLKVPVNWAKFDAAATPDPSVKHLYGTVVAEHVTQPSQVLTAFHGVFTDSATTKQPTRVRVTLAADPVPTGMDLRTYSELALLQLDKAGVQHVEARRNSKLGGEPAHVLIYSPVELQETKLAYCIRNGNAFTVGYHISYAASDVNTNMYQPLFDRIIANFKFDADENENRRQTYESLKFGVRATASAVLQPQENFMGSILTLVVPGDPQTNMNVIKIPGHSATTLERSVAELRPALESMLHKTEDISVTDSTMDGRPAKEIVVTGQVQQATMKIRIRIMVDGTDTWGVNMFSEVSKYEANWLRFGRVLFESIHLFKPT